MAGPIIPPLYISPRKNVMVSVIVAIGTAVVNAVAWLGSSGILLVGSILANLLFGGTTTEGPRLDDLTVTSSAYGRPIPLCYGEVRIAGNIIWSTGLEEVRREEEVGGIFGFGASTQVYYEYYSTFAIGFANTQVSDLTALYADGKIMYSGSNFRDDTSVVDVLINGIAGNTVYGGVYNKFARKDGLYFNFYTGTETQNPDDIIVDDVGADAPAYRGLSYMVFDRLPLKDYGNRIPNITAVLSFNSTSRDAWREFESYPDSGPSWNSNTQTPARSWHYDKRRSLIYTHTYFFGETFDTKGIIAYNSETGVVERWATVREIFQNSGEDIDADWSPVFFQTYAGTSGEVIFAKGGKQINTHPIIAIDKDTLRYIGHFGPFSGGISTAWTRANGFGVVDQQLTFTVTNPLEGGPSKSFFVCARSFAGHAIGLVGQDGAYCWGEGITPPGEVQGLVEGKHWDGVTDIWVICNDGSDGMILSLLKVFYNASFDTISLRSVGIVWDSGITTIADSQLNVSRAGPGHLSGVYAWRDDPFTDKGALLGWLGDFFYISLDSYTVEYTFPIPAGYNIGTLSGGAPQAIRSGDRTFLISDDVDGDTSGSYMILNVGRYSARIEYTGEATFAWSTDGNWYIWDSARHRFLTGGNTTINGGWYYPDVSYNDPPTVGTIVSDLMVRGVYEASDFDVTNLTNTVWGYSVSRESSIKAAIQPLSASYFFDAVESDYIIKFVPRGSASVASIPEIDLVELTEGADGSWVEARSQELELPSQIDVAFGDPEREFQPGLQTARRVSDPTPSMYSKSIAKMSLPIVMNSTSARQVAEKALFTTWLERDTYSTTMAHTWLKLDPTDVVTVTLNNGVEFNVRVAQMDIGTDYSIQSKFILDDAALYSSTIQGYGGEALPLPTSFKAPNMVADLYLMDVPLLRDEDSTIRELSIYYFGISLLSVSPDHIFDAGLLYSSVDGSDWAFIGQTVVETIHGFTDGPLADLPNPTFNGVDEVGTVTIQILRDPGSALTSTTEASMINGTNRGVLIKDNKEVEVIGWRDVVDNGNGSYTISGLLRGQRGTDTMAYNYLGGETFILLDFAAVQKFGMLPGTLGNEYQFRAGVASQPLDAIETDIRTLNHRALMPYAPVHATRTDDTPTSGDITLAWERRTRVTGDLVDGVGLAPLSEDTESYEIDILDGTGGTVLRTLLATTTTVVYDSADVTTDHGGPPATLYFRVYQMSAQVGRGFSIEEGLI
jgi:hypothetical protein